MKLEHVELEFIKKELRSSKCACVLLVDASLLNGANLALDESDRAEFVATLVKKMSQNSVAKPAAAPGTAGYLGHFIVLIGYDEARRVFVYRNPSSDLNISFTSFENLERARLSFGTDEDILFIYGAARLLK